MNFDLTGFGIDVGLIAGIFFTIEAAKWILEQNKVELKGWIWALIVLGMSAAAGVVISLIRALPADQVVGNVFKYLAAAWVFDMQNTVKKSVEPVESDAAKGQKNVGNN
jgi:hypothetical protein